MKQFNVEWTHRALRDLGSIHDYITLENPIAARNVALTILQATEQLTFFPARGRLGLKEGTRELVIPGWPWIVVYKVDESLVRVLAVLHGAQERKSGSDNP
ncbi:MAG: type II toxin-antitoxin system RelE/ParE family toxin [Rhodospirillales bacterium]|nr:type II toxin-antitoxin system RelE/ParE family toxin [Rhodospirillales bacterium]